MTVSTSSKTMAGRISLSMLGLLCLPSLRAKRSNPGSFGGVSLDCCLASLLAMTGLGQVQGNNDEVDRLDTDEGNGDAAEPVDQQVAPEQRTGADRTIGDAFQRERNQPDDDQRIEDDRRQD